MDQACGTCQFFRSEPYIEERLAGRARKGVCTHPDHRTRGVAILIFSQEMRCRRGFGADDWTPNCSARVEPLSSHLEGLLDDIVIDERPSPRNGPRRAFLLFIPIPIYVDREDARAD